MLEWARSINAVILRVHQCLDVSPPNTNFFVLMNILCLDIAALVELGITKKELRVFNFGESGIGIGNNIDVTVDYDYQLYLACLQRVKVVKSRTNGHCYEETVNVLKTLYTLHLKQKN